MEEEIIHNFKFKNSKILEEFNRRIPSVINFDKNDELSVERARYFLNGIIEIYSCKIFDLFTNFFSKETLDTQDKKIFAHQRFEEHLLNFIEIIRSNPELEFLRKETELIDDFINIDFSAYIDKKYIISRIAECDIKLVENSRFKIHLGNNIENEQLLDLSNSTATEKIIFLQRLGVIEFLKQKTLFQTSTNKLAEYLSCVTGEKVNTLQSYINPMINDTINQKNNPLNKESSVNKVVNKLISMGFKESDLSK